MIYSFNRRNMTTKLNSKEMVDELRFASADWSLAEYEARTYLAQASLLIEALCKELDQSKKDAPSPDRSKASDNLYSMSKRQE